MKKLIALTAILAILMTGCGQVSEETETTNSGAKVQVNDFNEKTISEIKINEIGGEDGRDNDWLVSAKDGHNYVILTDNRMKTTQTYDVSDKDFLDLIQIYFSDYIGKSESNPIGTCDVIDYTIVIRYNDETEDKSEVYIPALWNKLYEIIAVYEPIDEKKFETNQTDNEILYTQAGMVGEYSYKINNTVQGVVQRGYYFDEENRSDSPLYAYISHGEESSGGHGIYVTNLEVQNDTFFITVHEKSPGPGEAVTQAFEYPGCMVEISPKPSNIMVKNTKGTKFEYIGNLQSESFEDIGEAYYREVSEEDIRLY